MVSDSGFVWSVRLDFVVNYQTEDGILISQILKDNFGTDNPPACTWLNVKGLANEDFMIEIEAQAVI